MIRTHRIADAAVLGTVLTMFVAGCPQPGTTGDNDNDNIPDNMTTIEPDDFADRTELTNVSAHVVLSTTEDDNVPISTFPVTANDDGFGFAPTGTKVFGHANVQYFNTHRRLRMDFLAPVSAVQIQFAGGTFFEQEIGRLVAYDQSGNPIAEAVSAPKDAGASALLSITRGSADIAWALAYVAENEGTFGRFDALSFAPPVP